MLNSTELALDLKLRLYIAACCSIMTYGAEAWLLDEQARRALNGANAYMLSHITGNPRRQESTADTCTFNLLLWIRARRLRWLGHILRLQDERLVKQAIKHIHGHRQDGDMLMDVDPSLSWEALVELARDKDGWRERVRKMQREAKAKTWVESTAEVKKVRKEIKNAGKAATPESCFTYSAQLKPILQQTAITSEERQQEKEAEKVFLTGTSAERKTLQLRAAEANKARRAAEKRKRKETKRAAKQSTAKFFITELRQTDIRQFFKAKAKSKDDDKILCRRAEAAPSYMPTPTTQQNKKPPTTTTNKPPTTTTKKTKPTTTTKPPAPTTTEEPPTSVLL